MCAAEAPEPPPGSPPTSPRGSGGAADVREGGSPPGPPGGVDPRRWHYGEFYGLRPVPAEDGRPLLVVHGNCQAESLRVLLAGPDGGGDGGAGPDRDGGPSGAFRTVRLPPVHELAAEDLPHLHRVLAAADVLVSQPVRDGYRDLPLGTAQLAAELGTASSTVRGGAARRREPVLVRFPVIRWAGLFPHQAIVRAPGAGDPPVVPYHDLRTLVRAATGAAPRRAATPAQVRAVGAQSVAQLASRERAHDTVVVSDLLVPAGAGAAHTVNHPGNPVLRGLAGRVQERLGVGAEVADPGRTLLDSVHAPLDAAVLEAWGLADGGAAARDHWLVRGEVVADEDVRRAQLAWYREHPGVVDAGLRRHAEALQLLGLR